MYHREMGGSSTGSSRLVKGAAVELQDFSSDFVKELLMWRHGGHRAEWTVEDVEMVEMVEGVVTEVGKQPEGSPRGSTAFPSRHIHSSMLACGRAATYKPPSLFTPPSDCSA